MIEVHDLIFTDKHKLNHFVVVVFETQIDPYFFGPSPDGLMDSNKRFGFQSQGWIYGGRI